MELVLTHVVINECLKLKLPLLVCRGECLYDLDLLLGPLELGPASDHSVLVAFYVHDVGALLLLFVEAERDFPNTSVQNSGTV